MADDEEREPEALDEPGGTPAPDVAPVEPTPGRSTPVPPPVTSGISSHESPSGVRRDDNPFSFRHFLQGDQSLPAGAYERTGARPKTYGTASPPRAAAGGAETSGSRRGGGGGYRRSAVEPLGMPSLPDFVQDHILVEQAYLDSTEPIDLHNLPDFTSLGGRDERVPPVLPLDLPPHLSLDLTESVSPHDRRRASPRARAAPSHAFPLDLPPRPGSSEEEATRGEGMRLPDFLPPHPGRASPSPSASPSHHPSAAAAAAPLHRLQNQLHTARAELRGERARAAGLERELAQERAAADALRAELYERRIPRDTSPLPMAGAETASFETHWKAEIKRLKEELSAARAEAAGLRARQHGAARGLLAATSAADSSLRELLAGLDRLRSISSSLEPP